MEGHVNAMHQHARAWHDERVERGLKLARILRRAAAPRKHLRPTAAR
jgi:hypothetical protein